MNNLVAATSRRHALKVSDAKRAGKFKRVGESFLNKLDAELEALVFKVRGMAPICEQSAIIDCPDHLLTASFKEKLIAEAEAAAARIIQKHVQFHPSRGQTLQD